MGALSISYHIERAVTTLFSGIQRSGNRCENPSTLWVVSNAPVVSGILYLGPYFTRWNDIFCNLG